MESCQQVQLAAESFSYSWLIDRKPYPADGNSHRDKQSSFDFDVALAAFPTSPVHADKIFYNGHIMPLYADGLNPEALKTSTPASASPVSWCSLRSPFIAKKTKAFSPGTWRESSKRILQKCFGFVKPLCRRMNCSGKSNRVDDLERKVVFEVNSLETSPRQSCAYSAEVRKRSIKDDICYGIEEVKRRSNSPSPQAASRLSPSRSSDAERSIHEAILYCKRSIEK